MAATWLARPQIAGMARSYKDLLASSGA